VDGTGVRVEQDGPVTVVTIDRPERRNAVDAPAAAALAEAFRAFDRDPGAAVAVLTGAGGAFCAGADLKAIAAGEPLRVAADGDGPMGATWLRLSKPVLAAVEGPAVGGGLELALWCDLRVATPRSVFGCFERRWGVPLIDGGTQRLPRVVGMGRALEMILSGRPVEAAEAERIGLVNELTEPEGHLDRAFALAGRIASFPQETMLSDRRAALEGAGMPLADGLELERRLGREVLEVAARGAARFAGGEGRGGRGV